MALDVSKLRQQEQVQATGNNPAASTSASSSSQPIDMKTGTMTPEEKQAKILEFIKSSEFKKCPDDQKLELLKQQFPDLAGLPEKDIARYIAEAINTLPAEEKAEIAETIIRADNKHAVALAKAVSTAESSASEISTTLIEPEQPAETTEKTENAVAAETKTEETNSSELEQLAEKYCAENNIKDPNIDEVIATLVRKDAAVGLTEDEQKILDLYYSTTPETTDELTITEQYYYFDENGIKRPTSKYYEESAEKRLEISLESYIENNEKFSELSKAEQDKLVQSNMIELISIVNNKFEIGDQDGGERVIDKAHQLLMVSEHNNIPISELKNYSKDDLDNLILKTKDEIHNNSNNTLGDKNAKINKKILNKVEILLQSDSTYQNLKNDIEKSQYRDNYINQLLENISGGNFASLTEDNKIDLLKDLNGILSNAIDQKEKSNGKNPIEYVEEYFKKDKTEQIKEQLEYLQKELKNIPKNDERRIQKNQNSIQSKELELHILNLGKKWNTIEEYNKIVADLNAKGKIPEKYRKIADEIASNQTQCNIFKKHTRTGRIERIDDEFLTIEQKYRLKDDYDAKDILRKTRRHENKDRVYADMLSRVAKIEDKETREAQKAIIFEAMEKSGYTTEQIQEFWKNNNTIAFEAFAVRGNNVENLGEYYDEFQGTEVVTAIASEIANDNVYGDNIDQLSDATRISIKKGHKEKVAQSWSKYNTLDETITAGNKVSKDPEIQEGDMADFFEIVVTETKDDKNKTKITEGLSDCGNAAVLEGLAAAGNSVQNPEYRKQYNSIVTEAAKNYPPEVQNTIQTALTTGEISEQTRNSTAPASNSYYPEADTYTPQSTYNNTDSNTYNSNTYNSNHSSQTTTQTYSNQGATFNQGTTSNPSYNPTEVYTSNVYPQNTYSNSFVTPDIETSIRGYNPTTPSVETSNYTVSSTSTSKVDPQQVRENAAAKQAEANQQMKDIALENAAEVKQQIEESIAEWELKQELKLSDEVISELKEIAASEALEEFIQTNPTKKEQIIQKLSSATSLSEVYDILLSNLGSKVHQKFIDNLATAGSTSEVRAFLKSKAGNTAVIKEILLRTSNQTLRSELINMLPASDVIELLENNLISTLNSIDHKIIYEYLAKNIYSMTQTNFANYLKYLPFDEREKLIAMRNQAYGIKSEQDKKAEVKVETTTQGVQQNQQTVTQNQPTQPKVATNPQTPQSHTPVQQKPKEQQVENPQTQFKGGETTKVLNDGRVITRQGTTFAGISDNAEEGFRVVDPKANKKAKEGAPIGMNDEVLVPGSQEWLMKYNKQAPKTAFTMAALEEQAEDTGLNFGSNHAKIGKPNKKKDNPNGFNVRG